MTADALPPSAYTDPATLSAEREQVFRRSWVCVGLADRLAHQGDFVTTTIGGVPVVVRRFAEGLGAFLNVCSHRQAIIRAEPVGNGLLRCPYHGWTYGADGTPIGIPGNDAWFGLDRAARAARALPRFALETVGRFVFVRLAAEGPSLAEHLGPVAGDLARLSEAFPDRFDDGRLAWACDWKIGVENVLEVYHAATIHPETFGAFVTGPWTQERLGRHSRGRIALSDAGAAYWDGLIRRMGLRTLEGAEGYDHLFVFPNLAVGATRGAMVSVQTYWPEGVGGLRLDYRLMLAPGAKTDGAFARAAKATIAKANLAVLAEDRDPAERVQRGIGHAADPSLIGVNEGRILGFHAAWRAAMADEGDAA